MHESKVTLTPEGFVNVDSYTSKARSCMFLWIQELDKESIFIAPLLFLMWWCCVIH